MKTALEMVAEERQRQVEKGYTAKQTVGISQANCETCAYLGSDGDGYEYNGTWPVCDNPKRQHVNNLRSFPFKAEQKCWLPNFWQSKYASEINTGEDEEVNSLCDAFLLAEADRRLRAGEQP